jgi:uncharacterized protein (DUF924 family)
VEWQPILAFWFGDDEAEGGTAEQSRRWWRKDPAFDAEIRERFGGVHARIEAGACEGWLEDPRGLVAYVIVLDQFSRNMFRDTPAMFASDARALAAAKRGVAAGFDAQVPREMRSFLYMPYMHSESLADQDACVALFAALAAGAPAEQGAKGYAERHRDIIVRFGRFPHRNAILGRPSTPEEIEFLAQPGSSF